MRNIFIGLWLLLLFLTATASLGQTSTTLPDSSGWGKPDGKYQPTRRRGTGFIGWNRGRMKDSVQAAYISSMGLRHQFGRFYSNASKQWYVLSTSFGNLEGESHFVLVASPQMNESTFRDDFPYWHDQNGVYYARLSYYQQAIFLVPEADPATFRTLDFQRLAVDKNHVFEGGNVVPGLSPISLRVYTPNGEHYGLPDVAGSDAYLLSGLVGYRPNGEPLTKAEALKFRPPTPYKLAYPLPTQQPAKAKAKRATKHL